MSSGASLLTDIDKILGLVWEGPILDGFWVKRKKISWSLFNPWRIGLATPRKGALLPFPPFLTPSAFSPAILLGFYQTGPYQFWVIKSFTKDLTCGVKSNTVRLYNWVLIFQVLISLNQTQCNNTSGVQIWDPNLTLWAGYHQACFSHGPNPKCWVSFHSC